MASCKGHGDGDNLLSKKCMGELRLVLLQQPQFIKVHAAEYLIWLGNKEEVKKVFLEEDSLYHNESPYRIGIWRVLAQAAEGQKSKMHWINKILDVFADSTAPDRLHATETLAKLEHSPLAKYPELTRETLISGNRNLNTYALWAVSYSSDSAFKNNRQEFLRLAQKDSNNIIRKISAYILRKMDNLTYTEWAELAQTALAEPGTSSVKRSLLNTAFATMPDTSTIPNLHQSIYKEMLKDNNLFSAGERIELALTLADKGSNEDIPVLKSILNNNYSKGIYEIDSKEGADVRATAAYAILKIKQRSLSENNK